MPGRVCTKGLCLWGLAFSISLSLTQPFNIPLSLTPWGHTLDEISAGYEGMVHRV